MIAPAAPAVPLLTHEHARLDDVDGVSGSGRDKPRNHGRRELDADIVRLPPSRRHNRALDFVVSRTLGSCEDDGSDLDSSRKNSRKSNAIGR